MATKNASTPDVIVGINSKSRVPLFPGAEASALIADQHSHTRGGHFNERQWAVLVRLCELIIPSDSDSGGAADAGVIEFIDIVTEESSELRECIGTGLTQLNMVSHKRYGQEFDNCEVGQQSQLLDIISIRETAQEDAECAQLTSFFAAVRKLTVDAFFTSESGIRYLEYAGNQRQEWFDGCLPLPT